MNEFMIDIDGASDRSLPITTATDDSLPITTATQDDIPTMEECARSGEAEVAAWCDGGATDGLGEGSAQDEQQRGDDISDDLALVGVSGTYAELATDAPSHTDTAASDDTVGASLQSEHAMRDDTMPTPAQDAEVTNNSVSILEPSYGEPSDREMLSDREAAHDEHSRMRTHEETNDDIPPSTLVELIVDAARPRRNKRRATGGSLGDGVPPDVVASTPASDDSYSADAVAASSLPIQPSEQDTDDGAWREEWPLNEVCVVGMLQGRWSDVPALDGVLRTRMELMLVEQHDGVYGSAGTLPIFVMPGAFGLASFLAELRRARKRKQRFEPVMVEVSGILRQLPDRDGRYATERYRVLMGVEVHRIVRVATETEQFAYWRERATIAAFRPYSYRGMPYQRVTATVELKQRKPRLRGTAITHVPVDFLVAPDHEHADRFTHVGQRLLIEANITGETQRMHDNHPALEGIDDPRRRARLQVVRESIAIATLGEFPDAAAADMYETWMASGCPQPERVGRALRGPERPTAVAPLTDHARQGTTQPTKKGSGRPAGKGAHV